MTKDVIAMAREAGFVPEAGGFLWVLNTDELTQLIKIARNAALDEAAIEMQGLYSLGGDDIATVLRNMKEPTT